ncbi:MAG: tetratricopeptide repeat protein [Planctomycetaceae bacterium]|nr:tetratricopeptide repeat protein [Planctomycetaceae bacterium]
MQAFVKLKAEIFTGTDPKQLLGKDRLRRIDWIRRSPVSREVWMMTCWRSLLLTILLLCEGTANAAEIDDCQKLLRTGEFVLCEEKTAAAVERGVYGESWHQILAAAQMEQGKYDAALQTLTTALEKYSWSIRLRWDLIQAARYAGKPELAEPASAEIARLAQSAPWRYTDAENLVTLGRWALAHRVDAKDVQEKFFQRARRNNPLHREPQLALGQLALDKRDFELAAETFQAGLKQHPEDPDLTFGLAQALLGSDRDAAVELVTTTLELNPRHAPALLWRADRALEAEQYDVADVVLGMIEEFNPRHPEKLAFDAVISILHGDMSAANELRTLALSSWSTNPVVDHVIGRELSQKYRFAEGATYQQQALEFDAGYLPAQKQYAQDLLRLGREAEGWQLADRAGAADPYDVEIYNLLNLREELERFTTLEAEGLRVRMDPHEAAVYGLHVVELLTEARTVLAEKYQVELKEPTLVEIFPEPDDFAVRTFGLPGAGGYLGVCFGNVVTANSPASQASHPVNLESVLWHEYAHVITLNKTHNRMPRWLSEGISVYEERQRDPRWGEKMTPAYRQMILGGELTPIAELSGAFLAPRSGMHLQFAYFESSLVVEHIIAQYGFESLLKILDDLAVGMNVNQAIERHTDAFQLLEGEFLAYAQQLASEFGNDVDWSDPRLEAASLTTPEAITRWAAEHPQNYNGLRTCAELFVRQEQWGQALPLLKQAYELFPLETGANSLAWMLAQALRHTGDEAGERRILEEIAQRDDDHAAALLRLLELDLAEENWNSVQKHALQVRAIKPLIAQPYEALARAGSALREDELSRAALTSLLALDPEDPADLHFRLAQVLVRLDQRETAKRHVLMSLEFAPRYREALSLLLELRSGQENSKSDEASTTKSK